MACDTTIKNFDSLCRLCLVSGVELVDIFQDPIIVSKYGAEASIVYKIMVATNLEIRPDDELPSVICKTCSLKVSRSFEFRQQARRSEEILRRYVKSKKHRMQVVDKQSETEVGLRNYTDNQNGTVSDGNMIIEGIEIVSDEFCLKNEMDNTEYANNFETADNVSDDQEEQSIIMPVEPLLLDQEQDFEVDNYRNSAVSDIGSAAGGEILDANFEPMWMNGGVCVKIENESVEGEATEQVELSLVVQPKDNQTTIAESQQWTCQYCNCKFPTVEKFNRHTLIHTPEPPFPCDYCDLSFDLRIDLKAHWRVHCNGNHHVCQMCGKAFPDRASFLKHSDIHDAVKPYRCPICLKSFCYGSDLRKHAITHTGVRPYVCSICGNAFTRSTSLNKHLRMHNGNRPFSCPSCPKMFGSKGDLKRHQLIHSGIKPWICAVCSVPFNRKDKLVRHERLHTGEPRPFPCYECPTSFSRKEDLTKHIQFHHYKAPRIMDTRKEAEDAAALDKISASDLERGNETFKLLLSEISVNKNLMTTPKPSIVDYSRFVKSTSMMTTTNNVSIQVVSNKTDVRVTTASTTSAVALSRTNNAIPEPIFKCDICYKHFDARHLLDDHKKIHSAIKPFACTVCEKSFYRRRELTRHEAVHTGYKPYSCGVCGKCFSRTDKLNRHVQTHEYKSTYRNISCDVCSLNFRTEIEFGNHKIFCCPDDDDDGQDEDITITSIGTDNSDGNRSDDIIVNNNNNNGKDVVGSNDLNEAASTTGNGSNGNEAIPATDNVVECDPVMLF